MELLSHGIGILESGIGLAGHIGTAHVSMLGAELKVRASYLIARQVDC
jgi:hypothetical protein